ncbi:MAG: putative endolysin [Prokaryotic dsDNA virus sp.]|nr:MAG: putative endolysin [Prokaryotic dsDNA virus sp.]|tara:strand:+ start:11066 stop:11542 length:477 start_codon:yes stop_codon:yes gene_type:complete
MFGRFRKVVVTTTATMALAIPMVAGFEGYRSGAYLDAVGIPTICFGETKGVQMGDSKTREECEDMLEERLVEFENGVRSCLPSYDDLTPQTQAAFVSFSYNVGTGAFCRSTLRRKAEAGDLVGACNELPRWNKAGGVVLPGLSKRREEERQLCLAGLS